jgi:type II secretory pathway pseudopilin PulG
MSRHEPPHPARRPRARRRVAALRDEAGYTLIELLIAMSMFMVVLAAVMALWDTASNAGYNEGERNTALAEETTGLDRMVRDLRQAYHINGPAAGQKSDWIDILERTTLGAAAQHDYRVIYDCSKTDPSNSAFHACYRYQSLWGPGMTLTAGVPPAAGVTSTIVVPRLLNGMACSGAVSTDCIFTNLTNPQGSTYGPTYATLTIRTASRGERQPFKSSNYNHDVVLSESVYMRQLDFGR